MYYNEISVTVKGLSKPFHHVLLLAGSQLYGQWCENLQSPFHLHLLPNKFPQNSGRKISLVNFLGYFNDISVKGLSNHFLHVLRLADSQLYGQWFDNLPIHFHLFQNKTHKVCSFQLILGTLHMHKW